MSLLTPDRKNRNGHPIIAADISIAPTVLDDGWPLANDETRLFWGWQPYRYVLSRPRVATPGTQFNYNGGGSAVLADIVVRVTQKPLRDLARVELFEPLGIREWELVGDL